MVDSLNRESSSEFPTTQRDTVDTSRGILDSKMEMIRAGIMACVLLLSPNTMYGDQSSKVEKKGLITFEVPKDILEEEFPAEGFRYVGREEFELPSGVGTKPLKIDIPLGYGAIAYIEFETTTLSPIIRNTPSVKWEVPGSPRPVNLSLHPTADSSLARPSGLYKFPPYFYGNRTIDTELKYDSDEPQKMIVRVFFIEQKLVEDKDTQKYMEELEKFWKTLLQTGSV